MDRNRDYISSMEGDQITAVIDDWYNGLDAETKPKVDQMIRLMAQRTKKLGEIGGREALGKVMLFLMQTRKL